VKSKLLAIAALGVLALAPLGAKATKAPHSQKPVGIVCYVGSIYSGENVPTKRIYQSDNVQIYSGTDADCRSITTSAPSSKTAGVVCVVGILMIGPSYPATKAIYRSSNVQIFQNETDAVCQRLTR
jgi:hypothetical protein